MRIWTRGQAPARGLRTRVLLLTLGAFIAVAIPAYAAFTGLVDTAVVRLGTLFAEKQILFDRYRGLGVLGREASLAETLSRAPAILDWARDEDDPAKRARGLAELEHYRTAFADQSYFFVVGASGNYYFNDRADAYADRQFSYTLSPADPKDAWYYKTIELDAGCHLNVNNDKVLAVTKVWINCVIREGGQVLGMLGTGVELTAFIREVVDIPQPGVQAMFIDASGAVQAHRDASLVDFHSLTKQAADKKTVFGLLDRPEDRDALRAMMAEVTSGDVEVRSAFLRLGGRTMLVGVGYLDQLGWYNVTIMDVDKIIDRSLFLPIGGLLAIMMLAAVGLIALLFKRVVLDRLAGVEAAVREVEAGNYASLSADAGGDEIGRLSRALVRMASAVGDNRQMLECMVRERTEELERLANRDALAGVLNRRGFTKAYAAAQARAEAGGRQMGLLLIDLDRFKQINDTLGHQAGDFVVLATARRITELLGEAGICARWGGDEFIVLIEDCALQGLRATAHRLMAAISHSMVDVGGGRQTALTVSIGACLIEPGEAIERAADMADTALYMAKGSGRNKVVVFETPPRAHSA